jgi:hypothetical protein
MDHLEGGKGEDGNGDVGQVRGSRDTTDIGACNDLQAAQVGRVKVKIEIVLDDCISDLLLYPTSRMNAAYEHRITFSIRQFPSLLF